jgi:glycosyltransferase involved in cell wall biosynthesis
MSSPPAMASAPDCSIVVPVYRNEANIDQLLERLRDLHTTVPGGIEAVCVVDGSPDQCYSLLAAALPNMAFPSRLLLLSRNFGSFPAIREGLRSASGPWFAVMAADLQEEASVVVRFFDALRADEADVVLGVRTARADAWFDRVASSLFWGLYRTLIQRDLPRGGVDVFGCNVAFRDQLLRFSESHSSLVGQVLWLGFRRKSINYRRVPRQHGQSAWNFRRKLAYLFDSIYSFSDLPIRLFIGLGGVGIVTSTFFAIVVVIAKISGSVPVPGYTATVLTIIFFASLNLLGLGILGSYMWRAYENTKARPIAVVMQELAFAPRTRA